MIKTAMLLAAGFGTRMKPLTDDCPKPLVRLGGKALIDWTLDRMRAGGIENFVINIHYLPHHMRRYLAHQPDVHLIEEPAILETGGGVKNALPLLGEEAFFVLNTDTIIKDRERPVNSMMTIDWQEEKMDILLLLHERKTAFGYDGRGDFHMQPDGRPRRRAKDELADYVFTGAQIIHPRIFSKSPSGAFSLNILYDKALAAGRLFASLNPGEWYHIGTADSLNRAQAFFLPDSPAAQRPADGPKIMSKEA